MRQKLHLITLGVDNIEKSTTFFEDGLGWKRSSASIGDLILFSLGSFGLALYPRDLLAEDATVDAEGSGFRGITLSFNTDSEKEVDEILQLARKAGAEIVKPGQKVFWGGYSGYFRDPNGHLFEVAHNPFWQMDENGNLELP